MIFRWRENQVRSFDAEKTRYKALDQRYAGLKAIEVDRIVGSVGRASELDAHFRWRGRKSDDRSRRIEQAMERGEVLPPISVYELDGNYFVIDGHHRVSAAKKLGQAFLDADVTSLIPVHKAGQAQAL